MSIDIKNFTFPSISKDAKLTFMTALFVMGMLASNLLGSKLFEVFDYELWGINFGTVSVGIFAYPLTFMVTDAVSEVYGKKKAKQIFWSALIAQFFVLLLVLFAVKAEPSWRYGSNYEYVEIFSQSSRMITASLIAFFVSQNLDIFTFHFFKKKTGGRYLWLRNNLSTMTSQAVDTLLFMYIAFYNTDDMMTGSFVFSLCVNYWLFKIVIAAIDTPFVYGLVKWLRSGDEN